jgi:hypothetical protein
MLWVGSRVDALRSDSRKNWLDYGIVLGFIQQGLARVIREVR